MTGSFPVKLTDTAQADLQAGWTWCRAQDPAAAEIWKNGLRAAIRSLELMPDRTPPAPEGEGLGQPIHALVFGRLLRCRIFYHVAPDEVTVLAIRHDASAD